MPGSRRLAAAFVVAAYAAVLAVPCGSMARPLSETRVVAYCECPAHAAHGSSSATPLEFARLPSLAAPPPHAPRWTRVAAFAPGLPPAPSLEPSPPVPRPL